MKKMLFFMSVMGALFSVNAMEERVEPASAENDQGEAREKEEASQFMTVAHTYGVARKQGVYRSGLDLLRIYNAASPGSKKVLNQLALLFLELSIEQLSQELQSQGALDAAPELHVSVSNQLPGRTLQGMVEVESDAIREARYRAYPDLIHFITVLDRYTERERLALLLHYYALNQADNAQPLVEAAEFLVQRVLHKTVGELMQEEAALAEPGDESDEEPPFYGAGMRAPLPLAPLGSPDGGPNWKKHVAVVGGVAAGAALLHRWWNRSEPAQQERVQGKIVPHGIMAYISWSRDKVILAEHANEDFAVLARATFRDRVDPQVILRGLNHFLTVIAPIYLAPTQQKGSYDIMIANMQKYQKDLTETVRIEQTDTSVK